MDVQLTKYFHNSIKDFIYDVGQPCGPYLHILNDNCQRFPDTSSINDRQWGKDIHGQVVSRFRLCKGIQYSHSIHTDIQSPVSPPKYFLQCTFTFTQPFLIFKLVKKE